MSIAAQGDMFSASFEGRPFRLAVCGGRDFKEKDYLDAALDEIVKDQRKVIVATGDARGADALARTWALSRKHKLVPAFVADWKRDGKAAGPIRNGQLLFVFRPDLVVAFHGGQGTEDMIAQARRRGIAVVRAGGSPQDILRFRNNEAALRYEKQSEA